MRSDKHCPRFKSDNNVKTYKDYLTVDNSVKKLSLKEHLKERDKK